MNIFISHATADQALATQLSAILRRLGNETTSSSTMAPGADYQAEILAHIRAADIVVVLLAPSDSMPLLHLGIALGAGSSVLMATRGTDSPVAALDLLPHLELRGSEEADIRALVGRILAMQPRDLKVPLPAHISLTSIASHPQRRELVDAMTLLQFETAVRLWFTARGIRVLSGQRDPDAGYDFLIESQEDGGIVPVTIAKYAAQSRVSVDRVLRLVGGMRFLGVQRAMFVSTAPFSAAATALAVENGVQLHTVDTLLDAAKSPETSSDTNSGTAITSTAQLSVRSSIAIGSHRYGVLELLSDASSGRLCFAHDTDSDSRVVIRQVTPVRGRSCAHLERDLVTFSTHVDNAFVAAVLNYDIAGDICSIVSEYCDGGSLRSWIEQRQPVEVILAALGHITQGLAGIHRAGVVHRDIRPSNLLVSNLDNGTALVKLTDYALGPVFEQSPAPGMLTYAAPEILAGADFRSDADIYSLGVVALELLTGTRYASAVEQITEPRELRSLIQQMLDRRPARRPNIDRIAGVLAALVDASRQSFAEYRGVSHAIPGAQAAGRRVAAFPMDTLLELATSVPEWRLHVKRVRKSAALRP